MSLEFTGKLCDLTMNNNAKFDKKLAFQFKIDMGNFTNFDPSTQRCHKFSLQLAAFDQIISFLS